MPHYFDNRDLQKITTAILNKPNFDKSLGGVDFLLIHGVEDKEKVKNFLNVLSNDIVENIKKVTGYDFSPRKYQSKTEKPILFDSFMACNGVNFNKEAYTIVAFSFKIAHAPLLDSDNLKFTTSLYTEGIYHELLHSLFAKKGNDNLNDILKEEFLADAFAVRFAGKENSLARFKEFHDMGQPMDITDPNHPSLRDRINAIITDKYADPIDKILDLVRERTKQGKGWAGMLMDKNPDDFISR